MITRVKPGGKTLSPKPLYDVLCSAQDKNINIIENIIQRELVWTYACIETFRHDVLECIKLNIEQADTTGYFGKVFDKAYMVAGNIEYSKPDACNQKYLPPMDIGEYKSVVDGSQRNRISLFMLIAILYEITKQNGFDFINTLLADASRTLGYQPRPHRQERPSWLIRRMPSFSTRTILRRRPSRPTAMVWR